MAMKTLKSMRSMLRMRLGEAVPRPEGFTDLQLNLVISYGQFDVIKRLLKTDQETFYKKYNLSLSSGVISYDLPSDCMQIVYLEFGPLPAQKIDVADLDVIRKNDLYAATTDMEMVYWYRVGDKVYIESIPTVTVYPTAYLYYIQKPVELTADADVTVIPEQYIDFVIKFCLTICLPIIGKSDEAVKASTDYETSFKEFEEQYLKNQLLGEKLPGDNR